MIQFYWQIRRSGPTPIPPADSPWYIYADVRQYFLPTACSTSYGGGADIQNIFESTVFSSTAKCSDVANYAMTFVKTTGYTFSTGYYCDFSSMTLEISAY